jgi:hypothetical protein
MGSENIFNGIQTSAELLFTSLPQRRRCKVLLFFLKKELTLRSIGTTKPYFQTSSGEDNLNTYKNQAKCRVVILIKTQKVLK